MLLTLQKRVLWRLEVTCVVKFSYFFVIEDEVTDGRGLRKILIRLVANNYNFPSNFSALVQQESHKGPSLQWKLIINVFYMGW
jgi:hypothetical protein